MKGRAHLSPVMVTFTSTRRTLLLYASLEAYGSAASAQLRQLHSTDEGATWLSSPDLPFKV